MSARSQLVVASVAILGALAALLLQAGRVPGSLPAPNESDGEPLSDAAQAPSAEVTEAHSPPPPPLTSLAPSASSAPDIPVTPPVPPLTVVSYAVLGHRNYQRLADLMSSEPIDETWAKDVGDRFFESIAASGVKMSTANVHCRTTICRGEWVFAEEYDSKFVLQNIINPVVGAVSRLDHANGYFSELPDDIEAIEGSRDLDLNVMVFYVYRRDSLPPRER